MGVESPTDDDTAGTDLVSLQETLDTDEIVFVDSLSSEIDAAIADAADLHRYEYVIGEVSDYGIASSDHVHFDLVHDGDPLHCVILQFRRDAIATDLDDGMQVAVSGDLSFYTDDNYCSIMVEDVIAVGTGVYQQTYEQNKQTLADDGLLDAATKQPLPAYPHCIGLATSAESDAREDAVTSIRNRHPGMDISIEDTAVQGDAAGQSMMQAIGALDNDAQVDLIVLTRGGGADKHLRVFNDTALCRVIHGTTTPIVVGVGHEADRTLADEVADERVMTPTEVGEIVPHKQTLTDETDALAERLDTVYTRTVTTSLEATATALDDAYTDRLQTTLRHDEQALDQAFETLASERLTTLTNRLDHAIETVHQQKTHEQQKEQAIAETKQQTKAEVQETYETTHRRQRLVIGVLLVVLVLVVVAVFSL
jgi:exodeoxyribonuclease VII large subunit